MSNLLRAHFKKPVWRVSVKKFISNFDGFLAEIEHGRTILLLVHGKAQGKLVPIVDRRRNKLAATPRRFQKTIRGPRW